jgi:glycosyltransferase involved in cell wall biosynthesis
MEEKIKIDYFISHPIQYFSPLFRKMAERMDLKVYYFSDVSVRGGVDKGFGTRVKWDIPLLNGYKYQFLRNWSKRRSMDGRFFDAVNPGVFAAVRKSPAKIVAVNGWNYASNWLVMIAAKIYGKEVWLRAENPLNQELRKKSRLLFLKRFVLKRILFSLFVDKCLYIGTESRKFFEHYGVPRSRLVFTPYAVDNEYFQNAVTEQSLELIKGELGLPIDKKIILFSGKFIEKKRPMDLLRAFHLLNNGNYLLVMVGEGELRREMELFINNNGLKNVILTGFVNQALIPKYYKVADVFVMCSGMGETWGLSVNEAMNFSLPVVISTTCGCHFDLVRSSRNGFTFEEGDIDQLASKLASICSSNELQCSMGQASREIIDEFNIDKIVDNLLQSVTK